MKSQHLGLNSRCVIVMTILLLLPEGRKRKLNKKKANEAERSAASPKSLPQNFALGPCGISSAFGKIS